MSTMTHINFAWRRVALVAYIIIQQKAEREPNPNWTWRCKPSQPYGTRDT